MRKFSTMGSQTGTSRNAGYIRHGVSGDGDCAYTAFGITRNEAYQQIKNSLSDANVISLLQPVMREQLLQEKFLLYLGWIVSINPAIITTVRNDPDGWDTYLPFVSAYVDYDIKEKRIDAGWGHPAILQVLAHIRGITLRIWQLGSDQRLIPYQPQQGRYAQYTPQNAEQVLDLLFINNNHFEQLEFINVQPGMNTPIYPFQLPRNHWTLITKRKQAKSEKSFANPHQKSLEMTEGNNGLSDLLKKLATINYSDPKALDNCMVDFVSRNSNKKRALRTVFGRQCRAEIKQRTHDKYNYIIHFVNTYETDAITVILSSSCPAAKKMLLTIPNCIFNYVHKLKQSDKFIEAIENVVKSQCAAVINVLIKNNLITHYLHRKTIKRQAFLAILRSKSAALLEHLTKLLATDENLFKTFQKTLKTRLDTAKPRSQTNINNYNRVKKKTNELRKQGRKTRSAKRNNNDIQPVLYNGSSLDNILNSNPIQQDTASHYPHSKYSGLRNAVYKALLSATADPKVNTVAQRIFAEYWSALRSSRTKSDANRTFSTSDAVVQEIVKSIVGLVQKEAEPQQQRHTFIERPNNTPGFIERPRALIDNQQHATSHQDASASRSTTRTNISQNRAGFFGANPLPIAQNSHFNTQRNGAQAGTSSNSVSHHVPHLQPFPFDEFASRGNTTASNVNHKDSSSSSDAPANKSKSILGKRKRENSEDQDRDPETRPSVPKKTKR